MSTRAIVGYKQANGTIKGAWNWNGGYDIKNDLKRDFETVSGVKFLLGIGMFSTIYSKKEYEEYINWAKEENIDVSEKIFIEYGGSVIVQDKHHAGRGPIEYKNIDEVLEQDINIAYIYENGEWKEYK